MVYTCEETVSCGLQATLGTRGDDGHARGEGGDQTGSTLTTSGSTRVGPLTSPGPGSEEEVRTSDGSFVGPGNPVGEWGQPGRWGGGPGSPGGPGGPGRGVGGPLGPR